MKNVNELTNAISDVKCLWYHSCCCVGKLQLLSRKNVGFIERLPGPLYPFSTKPLVSANNTWRIVCDSWKTIFTVVMRVQLAYNDYLQIKKKKIDDSVDDRFLAYHFSKKSVLVSLVSENRNIFTSQSSFLMGYVCVGECLLMLAGIL